MFHYTSIRKKLGYVLHEILITKSPLNGTPLPGTRDQIDPHHLRISPENVQRSYHLIPICWSGEANRGTKAHSISHQSRVNDSTEHEMKRCIPTYRQTFPSHMAGQPSCHRRPTTSNLQTRCKPKLRRPPSTSLKQGKYKQRRTNMQWRSFRGIDLSTPLSIEVPHTCP